MTSSTKRPVLPTSVWVLGFVSLLTDLSSEIYHSLLPAFVTISLGLPVVALGTIDGVAEATASFAKLVSGRLSDRSRRRKPWILAGYGLSTLSKPLFALAGSAGLVMLARFSDRVGKGIRGSPRDAMIADDTPPEIRGRAFGLRQALDTVGAVLAPLAAIGLMFLLLDNIRAVFWIAVIPGVLSVLLILFGLREPNIRTAPEKRLTFLGSCQELAPQTRRLLAIGFLFTLTRFSESFLILRGMNLGLSAAMSPLALVVFNIGFLALAYPAGALSDRISPRMILIAGIAVLVAGDLVLARGTGLIALVVGILLWGAHMALTQGIFSRMIADSASEHLRGTSFGAFYFVTGVATLLANIGAGLIWDRDGAGATFIASAGVAALAAAMVLLLPDSDPSAG